MKNMRDAGANVSGAGANLRAKGLAAALMACVLAAGAAGAGAAGQKIGRAVEGDTSGLRRAFAEACGEHFEIVGEGLRQRSVWHGADAYWLVRVRPKRSGHYTLKYRYDYNDPHYTYVEREMYMDVGEKGCRRTLRGDTVSGACLGDTVIFPIIKGKFTGHTFQLTRRDNAPAPEEVRASLRAMETAGLHTEAVAHPASEYLKYLGRRVSYLPHRNGGFTAEFYATFEAVKPGSFNLALSSRGREEATPKLTEPGSVPVYIVDKDSPLTVLTQYETVVGRDEKRNFSSHSGNEYLTGVKILQTGDRITLLYGRMFSRVTAPKERLGLGKMTEERVPVVEMFPFRVDLEDRYNEWIVEHLKGGAPAER